MWAVVSVTLDWLERLYGRSPGWFTICAFERGEPRVTRWIDTDKLGPAARAIERASERFDIYTSVGTWAEPARRGRGKARDVISIAGMWADLDIGEAGHRLAKSGLPNPSDEAAALAILTGLPAPSAVIHSGGGLQVWHLFDEPWVFDDNKAAAEVAEGWHRRLVAAGEERGVHVDALGDLARILRVPGTRNLKLATGGGGWRPVELREATGAAYPVADLSALGIRREPSGEDSRAAPDDRKRPDEFPLSWAQILEPHGWTVDRIDQGDTLWFRPGKGKGDGHSAITHSQPPVMVNYSATAGLPEGEQPEGKKLTKLRVYALLNTDGDLKAAQRELARLTATPVQVAKQVARFAGCLLDWSALWTAEIPEPDWLCEPLIERGRQVALFSEAKVGKSLLLLEICMALVAGRPVLGNPARLGPVQRPLTIVYIDKENTHEDLRARGMKMGYDDATLDGLHYYSFPDLSWLDTDEGGKELLALATHHGADLVVIDTLSRVVEGDEVDNDTYHDFYNFTGVRLKAAGIALVRLDHSGKDVSKGMRGASSKATDVDEVWALSEDDPEDDNRLTLTRTHSRSYHGVSKVSLLRKDYTCDCTSAKQHSDRDEHEGRRLLHHEVNDERQCLLCPLVEADNLITTGV